MKHTLLKLCSIGLLSLSLASAASAQTQLANPSFEEDVANVGNPDGWSINKGAQVKVVSGNASNGNKALLVENGYIAVSQDLKLSELAKQRIMLSIDAKIASDNPTIGARIGYYSTDNKWHDAPMFWNKAVTANYQTFTATRVLPDNAKPGRLWVGIYRSNNKGTLYLDNVKLQISGGLSESDAHLAVTLARDAQYFLNRLNASNLTTPQKDTWQKSAQQILDEANAANDTLSNKLTEYQAKIQSLNTDLFQQLANGKAVMMSLAPAYERLAPDALPPLKSTFSEKLIALRGEYQAFSLDVANGKNVPQKITIQTQGLPASAIITWRRQVFTETWYTKGKTLLADPLTKLASEGKSTFVEVQPGEIVRLFANIDVPQNAKAGNYPIQINLTSDNQTVGKSTVDLQVSSKTAPTPRMTNYAFAYTNMFPFANNTADTVKDLEAHGVTDIEWAFMPPATFDTQGNLLKANFARYNKLLKDFSHSSIRLNTFWTYTKMMTEDGTALKVLSPEWKNGLVQLFQAWIKDAEENGIPANQITVLAKDEIHSKSLESSPDASIDEYVEIAQLLRDKIPSLKSCLTLTYYAFPKDVEKALPYVDVVMPHMPQPTKLIRNAPPTYNPRKAFTEQIYPMLFEAQKQRGLEISSYHVAAGRSDDLMQWNRFYPVLAAVTGHTGIAFWAYNVSRGSTWNDTDGGLLDYNFVYNGTEKNPIAEKYNVTGEVIVPSIRWEAVRAGLQDANIILALQNASATGELDETRQAKLKMLLNQAKQWNGSDNASARSITTPKVKTLSQQLREIYAG